MSYIDDLIKEYCPDGVEWKELGEVSFFYGGLTGKSKSDFENGNSKYVTYKNIFNNTQVDESQLEMVRVEKIEKQNSIAYGDVLITGSSESKEEVGMSSSVTFKPSESIFLNSFSFGIRFIDDFQMLPEFSKHLFRSIKIRKQIEKTASGVTRYNVSKVSFKRVKIPKVPLKIQQEIVKILDKFTDYVTELTTELTDRQKQYTYYRDKLLSFEDEVYQVEWKTLGEVGLPTENISWKSQGEQCFSYIDLSSVDRDSKKITETTEITKYTAPSRAQKIVKENDIIFGTTRPTLRRYAKIPLEFDNQICSTGFYVFRASDEVLPNYIYHIFGSNAFNNFVEENQSGASYPAISNNLVEQYKLPVPSKKVQSRIVQVLDNFDAVCNDLNIGLPKEIELRQKQYEYFRDKLLTFAAEGVYTDSTVQTRPN
jgi:type I restriction enzyme S subunit